jgi:hypothetical protein
MTRRAAPCRSSPRPCRARARRSGRTCRRSRAGRRSDVPLTKVLLEPVRSAEPPISSGIAGEQFRPAPRPRTGGWPWAGFVSTSSAMWASGRRRRSAGRSPFMARVKSARLVEAFRRASHLAALRAAACGRPCARPFRCLRAVRTARGSSPWPCGWRRSRLVEQGRAVACGSPSLVAAPRPIFGLAGDQGRLVLTVSSPTAGRRLDLAVSWPSIALTAQPAALKRAFWSPVSAMVAAPSMVVLLSSNRTVSLLSFSGRPARWPPG